MLFTRKLNVVSINRAGLLAWMIVAAFPIRYAGTVADLQQWWHLATVEYVLMTVLHPYSYGDSAGFAPDFPFNPPQGNLVGCKCSICADVNNQVFILMSKKRAINGL